MEYINNNDLLALVIAHKQLVDANPGKTPLEVISNDLVRAIQQIAAGIGNRYNWRNYSELEDFKAEAVAHVCANIHKFNPVKSSNAFAYASRSVENVFKIQVKKLTKYEKDKRHQEERYMVDNNIAPDTSAYFQETEDLDGTKRIQGDRRRLRRKANPTAEGANLSKSELRTWVNRKIRDHKSSVDLPKRAIRFEAV